MSQCLYLAFNIHLFIFVQVIIIRVHLSGGGGWYAVCCRGTCVRNALSTVTAAERKERREGKNEGRVQGGSKEEKNGGKGGRE